MCKTRGVRGRRWTLLAALMAMVLSLGLVAAACGGDDSSTPASDAAPAPAPEPASEPEPAAPAFEPTTVRVGVGPFLDYMPWYIAEEFNLGEELGISLEILNFPEPSPGVTAMVQGDVDVVYGCHACWYPLFEAVPELKDWMITNQFNGFRVIGRAGDALSYDDLVAEGKSPEEARDEVLNSWVGKDFVLVAAIFRGLIDGAMQQIGKSIDDVNIIEFADDAKAALAYIGGEGDFYTGSLPQQAKLLFDFPDEFVLVGGSDVLGDGALWYSTMSTLGPWLEENREAALRLLAIHYRTMKFISEQRETSLPIIQREINDAAAADFSDEEIDQTTMLITYETVEEAEAKNYNPDDFRYWKKTASSTRPPTLTFFRIRSTSTTASSPRISSTSS